MLIWGLQITDDTICLYCHFITYIFPSAVSFQWSSLVSSLCSWPLSPWLPSWLCATTSWRSGWTPGSSPHSSGDQWRPRPETSERGRKSSTRWPFCLLLRMWVYQISSVLISVFFKTFLNLINATFLNHNSTEHFSWLLSQAFIMAFTSDMIPRMVYLYAYGHGMRGYINNSLSIYNISRIPESNMPEDKDYLSDNSTTCRY